jgi:hypothetical protein
MKREMMNSSNRCIRALSTIAPSAMISFAIAAMWAAAGAYPALAQHSAQQTFSSAADASQSLFQAVQKNNEQAITNILGGPTDLTSSGEQGQDKADRELFVEKYKEMHRFGREADGTTTLYIGAENWPFPVPLVEKNGAWRFDPNAGQKEVLYRRIGENELSAILTCHEFVTAEKEYRTEAKTTNAADDFPASLVAQAAGESASHDPVLLHGYYFRVIATHPASESSARNGGKARDGFALIAYPAQYRSSGVLTFIVTDRDIVFDKDLGPNTPALASATTTFHKDATWRVADEVN